MITASETAFRIKNFQILRPKVTKILQISGYAFSPNEYSWNEDSLSEYSLNYDIYLVP